MGIKQYKPTSAGRRAGMVSDFADCTYPRENRPRSPCFAPRPKKGGRNNQGIITSRFRGGGHKQSYRVIDFKRKRDNVEATVIQVEYDPNRSARIALIEYPRDEKFDFSRAYILAPDGLKAGDKVMSGEANWSSRKPGNCMPLWKIPLGMTIHNVELVPGQGGQICRSAGCSATLQNREKEWALLTMPSGEVRQVPVKCRATIGAVSNAEHMNISDRQGRPDALEGPQAAQPRHQYEPDRSPDGRRRRTQRGRPGSVSRRRACWPRAARPVRSGSRATRPSSAVVRPVRSRTRRDADENEPETSGRLVDWPLE